MKDVARVELGRRFIRRALQATGATTLTPELCQPHLRLGCTLANSRNQRRPQAVYQSRDRNGFGIMELLDMELARARQRLNRAERSLERANEMLDDDCGVGINIALCSRIRAAQQRVIEARSRLMKIDPTRADGVRTG
ncbi:hypothetical protein X737_34040 [Mesorhizobium sp. L48C026A00]|nr:hypothetical protein X737_34040 [Mesorhizobium sp. L48C026A00]